ncbi:hypothetical protein V8D89_001151 [Ganoderma adspersum]
MADTHFTVERVFERFGTREALIDFLLDTEDIDNVKKKLMNSFVRFRKVYNALLPESTSRLQHMVSKEAGKAWDEEKVQNPGFWDDLNRDFFAKHRARFPWYWHMKAHLNSLSPAERKAMLATLPDPKTRTRKKRSNSDVEREQTPRDRAAPYAVPTSRSRASRSSESSSPPSTSQASSSAGPLFPTPPTVSVHPSTYSSAPIYPYPHPPVPVYPSTQLSHAMIHPDGYMGWQTPAVAYPTALAYGNASLNGGQYMAQPPTYPVPAPVPHPQSLGMQMQNHPAWTTAAAEPAASYLQPFTVTTTHSACQWTTSATVPAVPYYHQPTGTTSATVPPVPYREVGFRYGTYQHQLGVGGDAPLFPAPAAPFPLHYSSGPQAQVSGVSSGDRPYPPADSGWLSYYLLPHIMCNDYSEEEPRPVSSIQRQVARREQQYQRNVWSDGGTGHRPEESHLGYSGECCGPSDPNVGCAVAACCCAAGPPPPGHKGGQWETLRGYGGRFGQVTIDLLPARRKRDPSYIPKPPNAFICFRRRFNLQLKAEKAEAARKQQDGSSPGEIVKGQQKNVSVDAGKVWRSMTAEEQAPYVKEAEERKREHERKYGKGSSAGKKDAADAPRKARGGKGQKGRATVDPAVVLGVPTASSSIHRGYGMPGPSTIATSSYALPDPTSIPAFDHENSWSSPFAPSESLLPTPALTPCHTLSPSPGPSLYNFPSSANVSRVASPAELDFASDGAFYQDVPHVPMASLTTPGDYMVVPGYQLYDSHPMYDGWAPLVPHHLDHIPYPAPLAEFNCSFPDQFADPIVCIPHPASLHTELEAAQACYTWSMEPVDQAPLIPAADLTVEQDVWKQVALQGQVSPGSVAPQSLDWWIVQLGSDQPSCNVDL